MGYINYLYILDYSDAGIYEVELSEDEKQQFNDGIIQLEDIVEAHGCNCNTCSWMSTQNKVTEIQNLTNY